MNQNRQAFLSMLAYSEGTSRIPDSDDGYRVIVGGGTFTSYDDHPRVIVKLNATLSSSAAGRYQLLMRYFDAYKKQLNLSDFSPASQDAIAIQQIRERRALDDVDAGRFADAVAKCSNIWASLPGNSYGQHQNKLADLQKSYTDAGGTLA